MAHNFFPMIARMRYIARWGLMRNTQPENIQEHSHQVAVLAHALAVIQNQYFGGSVDPGRVAVAALYHDASEILTGDLPTPSNMTTRTSRAPTSRWRRWRWESCCPCCWRSCAPPMRRR